mmetsp:Transcript_76346/g.218735  ORF Transcript_76346/g.218735 Transcript_76346/m.218735 type:complete len:127 (+) Transcript_76346:202-582(+)
MSFCGSYGSQGFYGLPSRPDEWGKWMDVAYGGKHIAGHSNIFFSNGELDPWTAAGVPAPGPTESLPSELIALGGHHLDLFFSTAADPASVRRVRASELAHIARWIDGGRASRAASAESASSMLEFV